MTNEPSEPFDISKISYPFEAELPGLGPITVRLRTSGFLRWFAEGEQTSRWHDGPQFMRILLSERGVTHPADGETGAGIGAAAVETLAPDDIEAAAEQLLSVALPIFDSLARQVRKGVLKDELADDTPLEFIPASERLLSAARRYRSDFEEGQRRTTSELTKSLGLGAGVLKQIGEARRLGLIGRGVLDQVAKMDTVGSVIKQLDETRRLGLISQGLAGQIAEANKIGRIMREHDTLKRLNTASFNLGRIGQLPQIAGLTAMNHDRWSSASRLLGLGLSGSVLLATQGLATSPLLSRVDREAAAVMRPGYQSLASLVLEGEVA